MSITTDRITKTPGVCGGNACIRGSRITVWGLASYRRKGASDEQILGLIQGLTPADLEAAWEYVAANEEEIDRVIRQNESREDESAE
jgi:type III restriction enzyme